MAQISGPKNAFERVLDDFKKDLTDGELKEYYGTTLQELQWRIGAIQAEQKKKKTIQNLTRLQGFLEAMETYSKVLEIFVNVSSFVAFVWGPMKFLLLTASSSVDAFSGLLDAYKNIAESLPLLEQYQSLFGADDRVQCVLELTFRDIFDFHREALRYFRRPVWKTVFATTWNTFRTYVNSILESLKRHRSLLVEQTSLEHFHKAETERLAAAERFRIEQEQEKERKIDRLLGWLSAEDVRKYQQQGVEAREGSPSSCSWILSKDAFLAWYEPHTAEPLLWIHGKPGVGKTVLASRIVEEVETIPSTTVLYFYCRHNEPERNSFIAMARTFLWELLAKDDTFVAHLYQASLDSREVKLKTQIVAEKHLDTALKLAGKTCIIVDGLDECSAAEQKHIVKWLRRYVEKSGSGGQASRCLFLSQFDATTKSLLSDLPALYFGQNDNRADLESYCANWAGRIRDEFDVDDASANKLASNVFRYSDGMFLYARLMMHHLSMQTNLRDLELEATPEAFPNGLEQAYARIIDRVLDPADPTRRRDALRVLELVMCAVRPLTWEEIQTALSVDELTKQVDNARRRKGDARFYCGALVDMGQHGEIEFVHSTVAKYLQSINIGLHNDHISMTLLCLDYFCFPSFDKGMTDDQIDQFVVDGSYGFADYAIVNWTFHLEQALKSSQVAPISPYRLDQALEEFFKMHWRSPQNKIAVPKDLLHPAGLIRNIDLRDKTLRTIASVRKLTSAEVPEFSSHATLTLFTMLFRIRQRIELMVEDNISGNSIAMERFYGSMSFKCSRLYCKWFHRGFETSQKRQVHKEKHDRSFYCPHPGCFGARQDDPDASIGFTSNQDLKTHLEHYHPIPDEFPPELSNAIDSASKSKALGTKSGSFRCDQCSQSFVSEPALQFHSQFHTSGLPTSSSTTPTPSSIPMLAPPRTRTLLHKTKPLVCMVCGKSYVRLSTFNRHRRKHPGQHPYICQGLLRSSAATWGCGRSFPRARELGHHLRSEGKACRKPFVDEGAALKSETPGVETSEERREDDIDDDDEDNDDDNDFGIAPTEVIEAGDLLSNAEKMTLAEYWSIDVGELIREELEIAQFGTLSGTVLGHRRQLTGWEGDENA